MLEEMDAIHLTEWKALGLVENEDQQRAELRAELAAKAEQGVQGYKRKR